MSRRIRASRRRRRVTGSGPTAEPLAMQTCAWLAVNSQIDLCCRRKD